MKRKYRTQPRPVKTKQQQGAASRRRGAVAERELAEVIRSYGYPAIRGQQRSGLEQADVVGGPAGWRFESKRTERLNLWAAWAQVTRDRKPGEVAVVATRRNHSPWLAVVELDTLLRLIRQAGGGPLTEPAPPAPAPAAATSVEPPPSRPKRRSRRSGATSELPPALGAFDVDARAASGFFEGIPPA
jgi:hypothetical protein